MSTTKRNVLSLVLVVVMLAIVFVSTGCTAPDRTAETLRQQGFTDVETTGYSWLACGKDDAFATGFTATNAQGVRVEGTVCCGWFKSCTVRF